MRPPSPPAAMRQAAGVARQPLADLLRSYPTLNGPGTTNVSTRHMQAMAKRANSTARSGSVLRDYLATV